MSNEIRRHIKYLIKETQEQGISFNKLTKMIKEEYREMQKTGEKLPLDLFMENIKKAFKSLKNIKYPYKNRVIKLPIFRSKKIQENVAKLLYVYYEQLKDGNNDIYTQLQRKFEIENEDIKKAEEYLYYSLALYYFYDRKKFMQDEALKNKTLKDFIFEIQNL